MCREGKDNCDRQSTYCDKDLTSFHCECKPGYKYVNATHCEGKGASLISRGCAVALLGLAMLQFCCRPFDSGYVTYV
jgi:hypothetical protein